MKPQLLSLQAHPKKQLKGSVTLPGSKSETNRALLFAALSPYPMLLQNVSNCEDSRVFIDFLQACGVRMEDTPDGLNIIGHLREAKAETRSMHLGLAGTALRFLTAAACYVPGTTILDGEERLRQRPVQPLVEALQSAGASITYLGETGHLPLKIEGKSGWSPDALEIDATDSSQLLSALLLLGPVLRPGTTVYCHGLASASYAELTLEVLRQWGVHWQADGLRYTLARTERNPASHTIESDWSAASYWLGLAATKPADLRLSYLWPTSSQGDAHQLEIFRQWGMHIEQLPKGLHVQTDDIVVQDMEYDFGQMPDLAQTFAVLATWASGPSEFTGLHTLPLKETDRLAAMVAELTKLGVHAVADEDTLTVYPSLKMSPRQPVVTYHDHRFAMSFALLANRFPHVEIADPMVVGKSYPDFWTHMAQVGYPMQFS